jgi:hypothetical protein
MTRDDGEQEPGRRGGHAGERRRQFEQQRGLSGPRRLDLDAEKAPEEDTEVVAPAEEDEPAGGDDD